MNLTLKNNENTSTKYAVEGTVNSEDEYKNTTKYVFKKEMVANNSEYEEEENLRYEDENNQY